jgi:hypothetical protein
MTQEQIIEFANDVNKFNYNELIPKIQTRKCKNKLEMFLFIEHQDVSKQFKTIMSLLNGHDKIGLDLVDLTMIIAGIMRSMIENIAVVNYLIHNSEYTLDHKISVLESFQNQAKIWKEQDKNTNKSIDVFIQENNTNINKCHIWATISKESRTLSKLIKGVIVPQNCLRMNGEILFEKWSMLSKLLHNNQLYRLYYFKQDNNGIYFNPESYQLDFYSSLLTLTHVFLEFSLFDLVTTIDDKTITNLYKTCEQQIKTKIYNKMANKLD